MNLKGRNFLTLKDFTPEEITYLIDLSAELKAKKKAGELHEYYRGKNIALIFEKTSTRTRCSFEVAAHDLGMGSTYLDPTGSQIGKKESIADTARVLGRMYDGIEYRGFGNRKSFPLLCWCHPLLCRVYQHLLRRISVPERKAGHGRVFTLQSLPDVPLESSSLW